jgi:hypothetical protein
VGPRAKLRLALQGRDLPGKACRAEAKACPTDAVKNSDLMEAVRLKCQGLDLAAAI